VAGEKLCQGLEGVLLNKYRLSLNGMQMRSGLNMLERGVVKFGAAFLARGDRTHSPSSFWINNIILPLAWQWNACPACRAGEGGGKIQLRFQKRSHAEPGNVHHVKHAAITQAPYQTIWVTTGTALQNLNF